MIKKRPKHIFLFLYCLLLSVPPAFAIFGDIDQVVYRGSLPSYKPYSPFNWFSSKSWLAIVPPPTTNNIDEAFFGERGSNGSPYLRAHYESNVPKPISRGRYILANIILEKSKEAFIHSFHSPKIQDALKTNARLWHHFYLSTMVVTSQYNTLSEGVRSHIDPSFITVGLYDKKTVMTEFAYDQTFGMRVGNPYIQNFPSCSPSRADALVFFGHDAYAAGLLPAIHQTPKVCETSPTPRRLTIGFVKIDDPYILPGLLMLRLADKLGDQATIDKAIHYFIPGSEGYYGHDVDRLMSDVTACTKGHEPSFSAALDKLIDQRRQPFTEALQESCHTANLVNCISGCGK